MQRATIGQRFAGGPNAFNLLRLFLALEVIGCHSMALRGGAMHSPFTGLVGDIGVDGFFALSGFLIVGAWHRNPRLGGFLVARARRILPGLWVCLAVTAFLIVPVATFAGGHPAPHLGDQVGYVFHNAAVTIRQWDISGAAAPLVVPVWNGSQWTLIWEIFCYMAVATLGVLGLLRRAVVLGLTVGLWCLALLIEMAGFGVNYGPKIMWMPQRAFLMFGLGALLWLYRDRIRVDGRLAAAAAVTLVAGALLTDNYRVIAAPGVAYLCVYLGLQLGRWPRLVLRNDISYGVYIYGFPLQQALLLMGWHSGWLAFFTASVAVTAPLAAASWFLVERPAQRLGRRSSQRLSVELVPVKAPA